MTAPDRGAPAWKAVSQRPQAVGERPGGGGARGGRVAPSAVGAGVLSDAPGG
jgi:hypothetical protein